MKICVYAIARDEAKHVERFCASVKDADVVVIADTGSTDGTKEIARKCGALVFDIRINPWRFDTARNAALALVPADVDVCVSLDLDEVMQEGWREEIERLWENGVTRLKHRFDFGGGHIYDAQRIHARNGYSWKFPCHEFQIADDRTPEKMEVSTSVLMKHLPDPTKSRAQYMDLLDMAVKEDPNCARMAFYYARELFYQYRYNEAIEAFDRYLAMPDAIWAPERSYAHRAIGQCHDALGKSVIAEIAFLRACAEEPHTRDGWYHLAKHYYRQSNWSQCYAAARRCTMTDFNNYAYTADAAAWGWEPYDLCALAAWNLGMQQEARAHGQAAICKATEDQLDRLNDNLAWYSGEKKAA